MSIPGPASPVVLSLRGVSKAFGAVQALRDVSVDCRAGEIHALVGENGSGKSTLLGIASGFVASGRGHRRDRRAAAGGAALPPRPGGSVSASRTRPTRTSSTSRWPRTCTSPSPRDEQPAYGRMEEWAAAKLAEFELDVPVTAAARVAVARRAAAPRGRQGAARQAEGAPPRRADDGARAGGGRAAPRARARAEPRRRRHRLRQPPAAGGARHRRPHHRPSRRRLPGNVRSRRRCRRRASSRS